ncbi:MAG: ABC transporter ATP-binding protein, partial [Candidatus Moraniibacteriota bacterium]
MISVHSVTKEFKNLSGTTRVLGGINLEVNKGEFVTVFGPNGSGKTTLLNVVSGIEKQDSGKVSVCWKNPKDAHVGFVFQNYNESLFPWRTVFENVVFPLEIAKVEKEEQNKIGEHLLNKIKLLHLRDRYVYELSGGQRQLVSICRAIASDPDILIMDEPFSSLDYSTTRKMELELLDIWQEKKTTTLFVSHDIDEAIFLADKVVVLSPRPASVKKIFEVKLPRPRTLDMLSSPE